MSLTDLWTKVISLAVFVQICRGYRSLLPPVGDYDERAHVGNRTEFTALELSEQTAE